MKKDTVLFVNSIRGATISALKEYEKLFSVRLNIVVLAEETIFDAVQTANGQKPNKDYTLLKADFGSPHSLKTVLAPYIPRLLAVSSHFENSVDELIKIIPYVPYLESSTQSSLKHSTEKIIMRALLEAHNPELTPMYLQIKSADSAEINRIESVLEYPVIIKPSGLAGSQLVSLASNRQELIERLITTLSYIDAAYKHELTRRTPVVLVEEFMLGEMYSIDMYVNKQGRCTATPLVHVTTGKAKGYDDFFGYLRLTPTQVNATDESEAIHAATEAVQALHLRSTTAHVELMHTKKGWKVIELGPRMGGYRHEMYHLSYGINHILNDVLTRISVDPIVPKETLGHTAVFNIYAKTEGVITSIVGLEAVKKLASFKSLNEKKKIGDMATHARNNGEPVLSIILFNANSAQLQKDIATVEELIVIATN